MVFSPIFVVLLITQIGSTAVSNTLAKGDTHTGSVHILNPHDGSLYKEIRAPFTWPVKGKITLEFGESDLPYQPFHTGIDIAGKRGDPVVACMDGTVMYAGEIFWGFGRHIILDHGNHITSLYAHLDTITTTVGSKVKGGDVIGARGSTGWSTGPHLHFQINVLGISVNPRTFLK